MRPLRKVPRHEFSMRANLHPTRGGAGMVVTIRDISTRGCQIEHLKVPKIRKSCELYFEWQGTQVGIEAKVVWEDPQGRMGLKYLTVDDHSQKRLLELCAALQLQRTMGRRASDTDGAQAVPESTYHAAEHPLFPHLNSKISSTRADSERARRTLPRYMSELRGDVSNSATGKSADVFLVDVSISGARLEGVGLPDASQACQLHTEWEGRDVVLPCRVAWKTSKQVGVRFAHLDDETTKQLRQICRNLNIAPRAAPV